MCFVCALDLITVSWQGLILVKFHKEIIKRISENTQHFSLLQMEGQENRIVRERVAVLPN